MFGGPTTEASGLWGVESALDGAGLVHEPGYGVFCGTDSSGEPQNLWPHISGIAALDYGITYYDLAGYRLGSGPPVPDDWFTGALDRRFGFDADGIVFGR